MVDRNPTALFNDIYDSTKEKVLGLITAKCGSVADIHDIFQETYMELFAVLNRREENYIQTPEAFVLKIAYRKIYRHYSLRDKLKFMIPMRSVNQEGEEVDLSELAIDTFSLEEKIAEQDMIAQVEHFLSQKPQIVQKIFYLYYYLDWTVPQIAQALSMSESNVKHKLYRTLGELRVQYKEKGELS